MLVVIDAVGIRGHGGAAVLCELLHWLPRRRPDWRWHVFLLDRNLREFDDPSVVDTVTIEFTARGNSGIGRLWWVYNILPARLKELGADLVFSMANIGSSRPCRPQVVFCHQLNALSEVGNKDISCGSSFRLNFQRYWVLKGVMSSEAVIVQTDAMKQSLAALLPDVAERVKVIPSGYRISQGDSAIRDEKRRLIDEVAGVKLIYVSHPGEYKNHELLIRAILRIAEKMPSVKLMLTIDPVNATDPSCRELVRMLVERILKEVKKVGADNYMVWLGVLTSDEVAYALSKSDLLVFPSLSESFGLPLAEAMAAGCPIAAADLPYAHDVAVDAAAYFDPRDPDSLADCVVSLFKESESLEVLASKGMARSTMFSYENIAESIARVLEMAHSTATRQSCFGESE